MGKQEYRFQARLIKILTGKGYLVINAASKQIFDVVAMKDQVAYPLEVKGKDTDYPNEQFDRQYAESSSTNTFFFIVHQSKKRGKMSLTLGTYAACVDCNLVYVKLKNDLEEYLD